MEHCVLIVPYFSVRIVLYRLTLISHAHSSQFIEWHNLGIRPFKHATYAASINCRDQVNS